MITEHHNTEQYIVYENIVKSEKYKTIILYFFIIYLVQAETKMGSSFNPSIQSIPGPYLNVFK